MIPILLLDISPEPVSRGGGMAGLVLIGIVVLVVTAALLTGVVFLMRRLTKTGAGTRVVIGDACLNLDSVGSRSSRVTGPPIISTAQPENNPNHP